MVGKGVIKIDHLEDKDVIERIILQRVKKLHTKGVDRIVMAQNC